MTPVYPNKAVDVAIVGAGPVGLTASLLLSRFHVHHLVIEKQLEPTDHPQAHFISCRSMEIFRELISSGNLLSPCGSKKKNGPR
jgi:2-polyprenyl-6-methoxyphenol hydroxylase-like FAD-dependent oxidoreductase